MSSLEKILSTNKTLGSLLYNEFLKAGNHQTATSHSFMENLISLDPASFVASCDQLEPHTFFAIVAKSSSLPQLQSQTTWWNEVVKQYIKLLQTGERIQGNTEEFVRSQQKIFKMKGLTAGTLKDVQNYAPGLYEQLKHSK